MKLYLEYLYSFVNDSYETPLVFTFILYYNISEKYIFKPKYVKLRFDRTAFFRVMRAMQL